MRLRVPAAFAMFSPYWRQLTAITAALPPPRLSDSAAFFRHAIRRRQPVSPFADADMLFHFRRAILLFSPPFFLSLYEFRRFTIALLLPFRQPPPLRHADDARLRHEPTPPLAPPPLFSSPLDAISPPFRRLRFHARYFFR